MKIRIDPGRNLPEEFRRTAVELADRTIGKLEEAQDDHAEGIHEARKAIKKLRALLRLARPGHKDFAKQENIRFRDVARSLAGPREASALVETVDRFVADYPDRIAACSLDLVRARLAGRRDRIAGDLALLEPAIEAGLDECRRGRRSIAAHDFSDIDAPLLAQSARGTLRKWKAALKRVKSNSHDEDFHELRKAVKAHEAHLAMLAHFWPGKAGKRHAKVDALGERLGEINDIAVMREGLAGYAFDLGADVEVDAFFKLMKRHEKRLKKEALKEAGRLLKGRPRGLKKAFMAVDAEARPVPRAA